MVEDLFPLSHESHAFCKKMSKPELEKFMDHCVGIVQAMQPFSESLETVVSRVTAEEAEKLVLKEESHRVMMAAREKIDVDLVNRLHSPVSYSVEGAGDPSEQLDRITRRIMEEKNLGYGAAFAEAQRERSDLASMVLEQLNQYRSR